MQTQNCRQVLEAIAQFEKQLNIKFTVNQDNTTFKYNNDNYNLELIIDPNKWLGLEFSIPKARIAYPINTDLYDLGSPDNQAFVSDIQADIVHFLDALLNEKILFSKKSRKLQVLIPLRNNKYMLLKQGRFFSSAKEVDEKKTAMTNSVISWQIFKP